MQHTHLQELSKVDTSVLPISIKIIKILRLPKQLMSSHPSCQLDESLFHCVPGRIALASLSMPTNRGSIQQIDVSIPTIVEFDGLHNDDLGEEQVLTLKIITKS